MSADVIAFPFPPQSPQRRRRKEIDRAAFALALRFEKKLQPLPHFEIKTRTAVRLVRDGWLAVCDSPRRGIPPGYCLTPAGRHRCKLMGLTP